MKQIALCERAFTMLFGPGRQYSPKGLLPEKGGGGGHLVI